MVRMKFLNKKAFSPYYQIMNGFGNEILWQIWCFLEFDLKIKAKSCLYGNAYYAIILTTFFVSQEIINMLYILLVLSKVKTRSKISMHTQICNRYILQAQLQFQQCFSDLISSAKETSTYQNAFSCAIEEPPPNFQLEVVNLQCNSMLKDKY